MRNGEENAEGLTQHSATNTKEEEEGVQYTFAYENYQSFPLDNRSPR